MFVLAGLDAPAAAQTSAPDDSICLMIESAARDHGLPVEFFARVIWQESRFRADAVGPITRSGKRAQGMAQFMPGTAAERGLLDPFDPVQALPKSAAGPMLVGDVLTAAGRDGAAAGAYGRARAINFNEAVATRLVAAQRRAGQLEDALSTARAFANANPHSTTGQLLVADVLMQSQNWTRAIDSYEAIRRQQGDKDALMLNNLAWARYRAGETAEALTLAAKVHDMTPQSGAAADTYGWFLYKTGRDRTQGLALLRRAVAASPSNPGVRWHLAQVLAAQGDEEVTAGEIRAALALPRFSDAGDARALLAKLS